MPLFDSVIRSKAYLLERCTEELRPATDCDFTFGYIGEGHKKFTITSEIQLAEGLSLVKKGMVTLWVDPHLTKAKNSLASKLGVVNCGIIYKRHKNKFVNTQKKVRVNFEKKILTTNLVSISEKQSTPRNVPSRLGSSPKEN